MVEFGAKYALLNKQGDCTEYSALFTALCRISNIPARLVAGLKHDSSSDSWIRHAWAEFYYNGFWIPVDVVEGYIIGFTPEIIPLFKGNWMSENMNREIKISILPEFETKLSQQQLIESYQSLKIQFKVYPKSKAPIEEPITTKVRTTFSYEFNFNEKQKAKTINDYRFKPPFTDKNYTIFCYYQCLTDNFIFHPKLIYKIMEHNNNEKEIKFNVVSPEFPTYYEQGIFITTLYGQILLWEKKKVLVY